MGAAIKLYSSDQPGARAFAELLAENLKQPVHVCPLSQLPAPDTQRPTKQQLRSERAALHPALTSLNGNIRLVEDSPELKRNYLEDLTTLRNMRTRYEERLSTIEQLLAAPEEKGGPQV